MKKRISLLLALALALTMLAACGANTSAPQAMKAEYAVEETYAESPAAMMMDAAGNSLTGDNKTALPENRKWIVTVDMSAETEDLDALMAALTETIEKLEGYVENQNIYNGSTFASYRRRNANLTIRIPAETVENFAAEISGIANVVSKNVNREDITLNYVATESKVTALKTEEARLLELLAQAETMSDLLEIEARLSDVRYELEQYTSQLKRYDNQVDYATIYLFIDEVQEYTPAAERTVWQRITDGFGDSLEGIRDGFVDTVVWVLANSPYLVLWGAILAALLVLRRKLPKKCFCRKHKKAAQKAEETPNE